MRRRRTRRFRYRPGNRTQSALPRRASEGRNLRPRLESLISRVRLPRLPLPGRRRHRRFRVVDRRRFLIAQGVLALTAAVALFLAGSVISRSIRTARLNRSLVKMHTLSAEDLQVEVAAPPLQEGESAVSTAATANRASPYGELTAMVLPDGSPIAVPQAVSEAEPEEQSSQTAFYPAGTDILPDMQELVKKNPDTVGWLSIAGTVHLPVVYRDNVFYLDHDFTGAKNASGTLFLDESSPIDDTTQNLLIHGHSMNDGSMFGILTHYRKLDYVRQHGLISFSTLWQKYEYAVFAVLQVSSKTEDANYFNYFSHPTFASRAEFEEYIDQLEQRSLFTIPVDVAADDALLTLSTCLDDDRLVVVARRLRPDETKDEINSAVETAY